MDTPARLIQITAPHMCAGLVLVDDKVVRAAPILHYMFGWSIGGVTAYCNRKGWTWTVSSSSPEQSPSGTGRR